jgi:hypothetical protein
MLYQLPSRRRPGGLPAYPLCAILLALAIGVIAVPTFTAAAEDAPRPEKKADEKKPETADRKDKTAGPDKDGKQETDEQKGKMGAPVREKSTDQKVDTETGAGGKKNGRIPRWSEIEPRSPSRRNGVSLPEALAVDFLVPGGGAFYHENYYAGGLFAAAKLGCAYSIWYFYKEWDFRRSLYYSARKANRSIDPGHDLLFKVPGEGYKTVEEIRHDYDRAAQNITFAVFGTAAVYAVSLVYTWVQVEKINEKTVPTFDFALARDTFDRWDARFAAGYSTRF